MSVKIGHIFLKKAQDQRAEEFVSTVSVLDGMAIEQHVLTASGSIARKLQALPYVSVGPIVRAPVMAYCLMPDVDLVHAHDGKGSQAGLLMTLTRCIPFVVAGANSTETRTNPLQNSILRRAQATIDEAPVDADVLVNIYQNAIVSWSKLPANADGG